MGFKIVVFTRETSGSTGVHFRITILAKRNFIEEVSDDNFAISLPTRLVSVAALLRGPSRLRTLYY
jgi:hypothetical protein